MLNHQRHKKPIIYNIFAVYCDATMWTNPKKNIFTYSLVLMWLFIHVIDIAQIHSKHWLNCDTNQIGRIEQEGITYRFVELINQNQSHYGKGTVIFIYFIFVFMHSFCSFPSYFGSCSVCALHKINLFFDCIVTHDPK